VTLPADFPLQYTSIVLGSTLSPGTVTLSGHDRMKNWDVQTAKGTTGGSDKLNGDAPGTFTATFYLAGDGSEDPGQRDDFELWDEFQKLIESTTNGKKPKALPIYHPDLLRNNFSDVCNAGISGMVHDGKGGATVTVKFIEYKPAKPKPTAKATAGNAASAQGVPDPNALAKAQLAGLVAIAKQP